MATVRIVPIYEMATCSIVSTKLKCEEISLHWTEKLTGSSSTDCKGSDLSVSELLAREPEQPKQFVHMCASSQGAVRMQAGLSYVIVLSSHLLFRVSGRMARDSL